MCSFLEAAESPSWRARQPPRRFLLLCPAATYAWWQDMTMKYKCQKVCVQRDGFNNVGGGGGGVAKQNRLDVTDTPVKGTLPLNPAGCS